MVKPEPEKVSQSLAKEYPEFVGNDKDTNENYFDIAALMKSKGHIK